MNVLCIRPWIPYFYVGNVYSVTTLKGKSWNMVDVHRIKGDKAGIRMAKLSFNDYFKELK